MRNLLIISLFFFSCASVQPLNGGDKDEIPPKVTNAVPDSASLNVTQNTITFTFDEYVKTTKLSDLLIISPNQKTKPKVDIKGKKVILTLLDTLIQNTTYTFQFNGSIIDINEGNPLVNYNYVFSTGNFLDSMEYTGIAINIETNKPCQQCNVHLYRSDNDSVVLTGKPDYLAKTDDLGLFKFQNLPIDSFKRIVLGDENNNLVLDPEELISLPSYITTNYSKQDTIYVFPTLKNERLKLDLLKSNPGIIRIKTNKPLNDNNLKLRINERPVDYSLSSTLDTISIFYRATKDTNTITLLSLKDTIDLEYTIPLTSLNYNPKVSITKTDPLTLQSTNPIETIDTSKIKAFIDSLVVPITILKVDSTKLLITAKNKGLPKQITLDSFAISDIYGKNNLIDTLNIKSKEITSTVSITFKLDSALNYIVLLVDENKTHSRSILNSTSIKTFTYLKPGMYRVKIITDTNKNGIWDTGNIFTKKEPEPIQFFTPFEVRENWDKDLTINVK